MTKIADVPRTSGTGHSFGWALSLSLCLGIAAPPDSSWADEPDAKAAVGATLSEVAEEALSEAIRAFGKGHHDRVVGLLQPLEQNPRMESLPEQLADVRALLATTYEKKAEDLLAIVIYGRLLRMPSLSDELRTPARDALEALVEKWHAEGLRRIEEDPEKASVILALIETSTRQVLDRAKLAEVRLALGVAHKGAGRPLLAGDMFLRYARMPEASANARTVAREEVESTFTVKSARGLLEGIEGSRGREVLVDLARRMHDLPGARAAVHTALGWSHYNGLRYRDASREFLRALRALPADAEADRVYLRNRLDEVRQQHFGELQVRCPVGAGPVMRFTVYGPVGREDEGVNAESVDAVCSPSSLRLVDGVYVVAAYGLVGSQISSVRYELALDEGERKLIQLEIPQERDSLHPMLFGIAGVAAGGAIGIQLYAAESSGNDNLGAHVATGSLATGSALLIIWGLAEWARAESTQPKYRVASAGGDHRRVPDDRAGVTITPFGLHARF